MNDSIDDISRWLHERPLQDNPEWVELTAVQTYSTWDEWLNRGKEIPDIENRLIWILDCDKDPVNRSAAVLALGFVGGDRSVNTLIAVLESDVPMVAMEAAAALGRLGKSEAIEPLCEALRNADANVRANACTALGWLGGEKAFSCLEEAEHDKDPFVRASAQEARRSQATKSTGEE
ncbi:MAG: HEAT repeat domain-containing protein [Leptolyngbyaceae cyanobacterium RM1_405_57]|nr:HEAT repeat domain-containing protein [Leptolyngbyaceae cyanobacterium RM1_405_57]